MIGPAAGAKTLRWWSRSPDPEILVQVPQPWASEGRAGGLGLPLYFENYSKKRLFFQF